MSVERVCQPSVSSSAGLLYTEEAPDLPFLNVHLQKLSTHIFNPQHNVDLNVKLSSIYVCIILLSGMGFIHLTNMF